MTEGLLLSLGRKAGLWLTLPGDVGSQRLLYDVLYGRPVVNNQSYH
jgi:hypothetical protein